ncbi:hypothetical protein ISCGN_006383 [Ixodes scapularis]
MSSIGSSTTAFDGRVYKTTSESSDYKVILPRLPQGMLVTNSLFLHADITGRPYKASDFKDAIFSIVDRKDVLGLGQYQMSHVWMVTFGNAAAKLKIKAYEEFIIKGKKCIIIDPCKEEIKMKLLWLPIPMPDSEVRKVLEPFGTVKDMRRETWRFSGLEDLQTTTREVTLVLKQDLTVDKIPHLLNVYGSNTLVVIPGRPPLCLRCKGIGHIRRQCCTPRCTQCWRFGHTNDECVVTYASKLQGNATPDADHSEHIMDVEEMFNEEVERTQTGDDPAIQNNDPPCSLNESPTEEQRCNESTSPTPHPEPREANASKGKELRKQSLQNTKVAETKKEEHHCKRAKVDTSENLTGEPEPMNIPLDSTEPQIRLEPKEQRVKPKFKDRKTTSPAASELDPKHV